MGFSLLPWLEAQGHAAVSFVHGAGRGPGIMRDDAAAVKLRGEAPTCNGIRESGLATTWSGTCAAL